MAHLDESTFLEILDFRGSNLIDASIAKRQMEVIRKGFNYLVQPENSCLYIADEVGLGKTYIAIGIASLLRHFSSSPETYQDVIIVPKENLQRKWKKEIRQFIAHYYKTQDNVVKSAIGRSVASPDVHEILQPVVRDVPRYHIYRMTSFSMGGGSSRKSKLEQMLERLALDESRNMLTDAYRRGYFNTSAELRLKKLYAYLLCANNPEFELLIVDEAHNFKRGLSDEDNYGAHRNHVVTRFLGLRRNSDDDKQIFDDFPELHRRVRPRVQKLLCLSATPKTYELMEIRRQFDCFLKQHPLSDAHTEEDVKEKLGSFLIRGKLQYSVGGETIARTLCRMEHRAGNADKNKTEPLVIRNDDEALVLGVLQYRTIKDLHRKYNATFEMGMLAGFETFRIDQERTEGRESDENGTAGEYEELRTRKQRESQDAGVLRQILDSYQKTFGSLPPHTKQDAVVRSVFDMMQRGEKSLIFVRRVATAYEMERRLLDQWETILFERLKNYWLRKCPGLPLEALVRRFEAERGDRLLADNLDRLVRGIASRLMTGSTKRDLSYVDEVESDMSMEEKVITGLYDVVDHADATFTDLLRDHARLSVFKSELIELAGRLLKTEFPRWRTRLESGGRDFEADREDESNRYFIARYFNRPDMKSWKRRLYDQSWFEMNYFVLNRELRLSGYDSARLTKKQIAAKDPTNPGEVQDIFLKSITEQTYHDLPIDNEGYPASLTRTTLLTELLLKPCRQQLDDWVRQVRENGSNIFAEMRILVAILRATLRNGAGLLPLFIADQAEKITENLYLEILNDPIGGFGNVLQEIRTIIRDFYLIRAVNFPQGESMKAIEGKLTFQIPALGITGQQSKNKEKVATQFRMPGFPYVLVSTDIFREGEDLHTYCQNVIHYGIAWNSSDTEQRIGRIDRINSRSHRQLMQDGRLSFENRVHVFYPYIRQTLEVNQVAKLFSNINSFVETFDVVGSIHEDGRANTGDAVESIPNASARAAESLFEHTNFRGRIPTSPKLKRRELIGQSADELRKFLERMIEEISQYGEFYLAPRLEAPGFRVVADFQLIRRSKRRGPIHVQLLNSDFPGRFQVEVVSYLYSVNHWNDAVLHNYDLGDFEKKEIQDYVGLGYLTDIESFEWKTFRSRLEKLVDLTDSIEEAETKDDLNIFE